MASPCWAPGEPTLTRPSEIDVVFKTQTQGLQGQTYRLAVARFGRIRRGDVAGLRSTGRRTLRRCGICCRPMAIVFHIKPSPHLRVAIKGDQVGADHLVMVPHRSAGAVFDGGSGAEL